MKKALIFFAALLLIFTIWYYWRNPLGTRIKIHDHVFTVEIAATAQEKEQGLGYRDSLAPDHGMLFPYDHKDQYQFWMKGMRFPLDFVWIDGKRIVDITISVPVATNEPLPVYRPKAPVDKILELNAGTVEKVGIAIGDTVEILR